MMQARFRLISKNYLLLLALSIGLTARGQQHSFRNSYLQLTLNPTTGSLASWGENGREFVGRNNGAGPLFALRLRNEQGQATDITSLDGKLTALQRQQSGNQTIFKLRYEGIGTLPLSATVTITCSTDSPLTRWHINLTNQTDLSIDHLDFPLVNVPNDLVGTGGDSYIFRPAMEGVVLEDLRMREHNWLKPYALEYPNSGWMGYYPASCAMQFWAYYNPKGGLYLAAHDPGFQYKGFEVYRQPDSTARLLVRLFPGHANPGRYNLPYDMVLGSFSGDWYAAADIYRRWMETSSMKHGPKLIDNPRLPAWFADSPVVVTYPVRGTRDMGEMAPNEYFPYPKALPLIDSLSRRLDSRLLALLMHWEGSAPWAPPYVWPPYGGEDPYQTFVKGLHDKGNLIGLYASGTGYTLRSNTDTTYNRRDEFARLQLDRVMTVDPSGKLCTNGVCVGDEVQRSGYDMCVSQPFVRQVVEDQVRKILYSGADYVQFFDQNIGGNGYMCYSHEHGHPAGPGRWQNDAMVALYARLQQLVDSSGRRMLIGCEGAAAEPFQPYLLMNDLRYNMNYLMGRPVPAYAYLYHEYLNSFMGNQVAVADWLDLNRSPLNMHQRVAHAFLSGDLLTLVLADKGQPGWGWGSAWSGSKPDSTSLLTLVRNLNGWRKGIGKPYLVYGRMQQPLALSGSADVPMIAREGTVTHYPALMTTAWQSARGERVQFIVNYTPQSQTGQFATAGVGAKPVTLYTSATGQASRLTTNAAGNLTLNVAPLSALMLVLNDSK